MEKFLTSAAVWQDFDPQAEPLETNVLKTEEVDGLICETVYFTGRTVQDGKTRVLGKVCYKSTKSVKPAVLLIDSYKRPIDEEELKYWAQNGFVAMAIDYAGRCTNGLCTLYPTSLDHCNGDVAQGYFQVGENAKQSKIYDYALNSMRAITYLIKEKKVKSVSVVTVKKGTSVGAIVLGTDKRIKNGAVVFGSLHREYPPYVGDADDQALELADDELTKRLQYEEQRQMWTAAIAPQSYAMQTTVPVYIVCSAVSPYVDALSTDKMYDRLNDDSRMLLLPDVLDYLPDNYTQSIVKWLKGATVQEQVTLSHFVDEQGNQCIKVLAPVESNNVELWYCRNPKDRARNWVQAPLKKTEYGFVGQLDVYSQNCKLVAFALVHGDVDITTELCEVDVVGAKRIKTPVRSVYSGSNKDHMIPVCKRNLSWHGDKDKVTYCKGYLDIEGAKGVGLATFALNDPCVQGVDTFMVSFDVCCKVVQTLRVYATCDFAGTNETYVQRVQLMGDGKWQRVTMEYSNFHAVTDSRQMTDDEHVQVLYFIADEEFIINNVFLV